MRKKRFLLCSLLFCLLCGCMIPAPRVYAAIKNQLVTEGEDTYYYNNKGNIVKNQFVTLDGKTYFFDENGHMRKGMLFTWKKNTWYAKANGVIAKNTFITIDEKRYYFDKNGHRQTGWITWKGHRYYCPASGEFYQSCWKKIGSHTYYFTESGYIATSKWVGDYYVNASGYRVGSTAMPKSSSTKSSSGSSASTTKKVIKMKNIKQNPQLPTGCESVALTMVLKFYGFSLFKTTIASSYLPKSSSNFVTAFWGSPFSSSGGGIYAPGLVTTANKYLKAKKSSMRAYDLTGTSFSDLYRYIDNGVPVIVWNSMYMWTPVGVSSYYTLGKNWTFYRYEHCVVLCGYNKKTNKVLINDSLSGLVWRNASSFKRIYNKMGKMAMVLTS